MKDQNFDRSHAASAPDRYVLNLYLSGMTPRSTAALARIRAICAEYLHGHYELNVIDLYQQPLLAKREQILATPTLVKERPAPQRRLIGDLSDQRRVLLALDLCHEGQIP